MIAEQRDEMLKQEVRDFWNANPCGTQFTHLEWGSKIFFDEVERFRYATQPFMHETMEFESHRGERLLEVGCGLGTDLLQFARGGAIVTGVDLTPKSVELTRDRLKLYNLLGNAQVADAEQLPFEDHSFDVVYSFGVLHHTPDTPRAIREALRVLKPGGKILMMLYHRASLHVFLGVVVRRFLKSINRRVNEVADDWIRIYDGSENPLGKAYTRAEVRRMLSGVRDISLTTRDPIRRRWPSFINTINQLLFARWLGFYLIIKAIK
jgi:ubiquinone/menaquinone biosynthesis C-methylase UbiE